MSTTADPGATANNTGRGHTGLRYVRGADSGNARGGAAPFCTSVNWLVGVTWKIAMAELDRALDEQLIAYLSAYEDYVTLHVEMDAQLKDGHLALSRAKRDLARSSTSLGQELFPRQIEPMIVVSQAPAGAESSVPELCYNFSEEGALVVGGEDAEVASSSSHDDDVRLEQPTGDQAQREMLAALERMGMSQSMQREIATAVRDDGDKVGLAVGDKLVIDPPGGSVETVETRAPITFSPNGLGDLKRAQFRAALEADEEYAANRPKPLKPSTKRDPLRWFTMLPPPSLRQGQKSFRRAAESAVALAAAQAKMHAAQQNIEALRLKKQASG